MPQKYKSSKNNSLWRLSLALVAVLIAVLVIYIFTKNSALKNQANQTAPNLDNSGANSGQVVLRHKLSNGNYDVIYTSNQAPRIEQWGDWLFFSTFNETKVYAYNYKIFEKKTIFDPFYDLDDITNLYNLISLDVAADKLFIQYESSANRTIRTFWVNLPIVTRFQELTKPGETYKGSSLLVYENNHWWLKLEDTESEAHYLSEYQTFDPATFKLGPKITFATSATPSSYELGFTTDNLLLGTDIVYPPYKDNVYIYQYYTDLYTVNPQTAAKTMLIDKIKFPKDIVAIEYSQLYQKAILIGDNIYIYDLATNTMNTIDKNLQIKNIRIYGGTQIDNLLCLYNSASEEVFGQWTAIDLTTDKITDSPICSDPNALNDRQPSLVDEVKQLNAKLKLPSDVEVIIMP